MPVSMTATSIPPPAMSVDTVREPSLPPQTTSASTRSMPQGSVSPMIWAVPSCSTYATLEFFSSAGMAVVGSVVAMALAMPILWSMSPPWAFTNAGCIGPLKPTMTSCFSGCAAFAARSGVADSIMAAAIHKTSSFFFWCLIVWASAHHMRCQFKGFWIVQR